MIHSKLTSHAQNSPMEKFDKEIKRLMKKKDNIDEVVNRYFRMRTKRRIRKILNFYKWLVMD